MGVSTVTKMCSSVCIPSDVDGIGMTRPVSCCYSDLCNTDGAASLRISFSAVGMLASSLCALFWTRLWGVGGEVFHAEEPNEEDNKPLPVQLSVWMPHGQPSTAPRNRFFSTRPFPTTKRKAKLWKSQHKFFNWLFNNSHKTNYGVSLLCWSGWLVLN